MTNTPTAPKDDQRSTSSSPGTASRTLRDLLLTPRPLPRFGRLEAIVLFVYTTLLAITIPFHELWYDEAQGWLIARDNSLFNIFYRRLHYEGSPGLWHLILWISIRLHIPYGQIDWISAAFAVAGAYVLLRYSPFPTLIRVLLPFTFFLQYQYAVIARSYAVTPLLAFLLCVLFFLPKPRPILFALCAGLMANLSLYALLWAAGLTFLYLPVVWASRAALPRRTRIAALAVLGSLFVFAVYTAWPAPDLVQRADDANYFQARPDSLMAKLIPPTPAPPGWAQTPRAELTLNGKALEPPDVSIHSRGNAFQRAIIRLDHPLDPSYKVQTRGHRIFKVLLGVSGLFFSISSWNLLALAFLVLAVAWLISRRSLRFLLPLLLMNALGALTYLADHHSGLFFVSIVTAIWLGWRRPQLPRPASPVLTALFSVVFLAVLLQQVAWSAHAIASDIRLPYDPGIATARYLQKNAAGKRIIAFRNLTLSASPYLPQHTFANQPASYWIYSRNYPYADRLPVELAQHPDFVVSGAEYFGSNTIANQLVPELPPNKAAPAILPGYLASFGYSEKTRFCGDTFFRGGTSVTYCNIIYTPGPAAPPAG